MTNYIDEKNRIDSIGEEWFKYNQWMKDPILNECYGRVHFKYS